MRERQEGSNIPSSFFITFQRLHLPSGMPEGAQVLHVPHSLISECRYEVIGTVHNQIINIDAVYAVGEDHVPLNLVDRIILQSYINQELQNRGMTIRYWSVDRIYAGE